MDKKVILTRKIKEETNFNIKDERAVITACVKGKVKEYHKHICANKFNNLT
jgi:hypothetical protein